MARRAIAKAPDVSPERLGPCAGAPPGGSLLNRDCVLDVARAVTPKLAALIRLSCPAMPLSAGLNNSTNARAASTFVPAAGKPWRHAYNRGDIRAGPGGDNIGRTRF